MKNKLTSELTFNQYDGALRYLDKKAIEGQGYVPIIVESFLQARFIEPLNITGFSLQDMGKVALKCEQLFDVITFDEHGYHNAFVELNCELTETSCDVLHQLGVSVLVYFTGVYGANFNVHEAKYISEQYNIKLCEINLPFRVMNLGEWDEFQWCFFDKRVTQALNQLGVRNEKYQS